MNEEQERIKAENQLKESLENLNEDDLKIDLTKVIVHNIE